MKILVAGIGGVGGYYGGLLADYCSKNKNHEIYFYSRKNTSELIKKEGLLLETFKVNKIIFPQKISHNAIDFGKVNLILLCTKSYDLKEILLQLKPCIKETTIFLPLLNGVLTEKLIENYYPKNEVWNGFVFLYAQKMSANHIKETNYFNKFNFGKNKFISESQECFEILLKNAHIDGGFNENIRIEQWEKFIFISTVASLSTYYNCTLGEILNTKEYTQLYDTLVDEIIEFSNSELKKECLSYRFDSNIKVALINQIKNNNSAATTSLQRDYYHHAKNELDTLVGIVAKSTLHLPQYQRIYKILKEK